VWRRGEILGILLVKELIVVDKDDKRPVGRFKIRSVPYLRAGESGYPRLSVSVRCCILIPNLCRNSSQKRVQQVVQRHNAALMQSRISRQFIDIVPIDINEGRVQMNCGTTRWNHSMETLPSFASDFQTPA